ncbi:ribosome-associated translation inhibitor RaiA [Candidatus Saccharibacteria bacterium]|nr:ribosome-associated translation inhibitor RaiA [Candidatus Saccharibacteria bacterium]MBI3338417.1 ribosome-associated translation inhibitor RaiA [Candidatus Saccharibacteria bacterium]
MIEKLEINGVHTTVDQKLQDYVAKKIGKLDRYIPKHARESAHVEIFLKETTTKTKNKCVCEVVMYLPHEAITTKESTVNMFAAVDIVEAKLKNRLKKYKETHSSLKLHRRILARMRRKQKSSL